MPTIQSLFSITHRHQAMHPCIPTNRDPLNPPLVSHNTQTLVSIPTLGMVMITLSAQAFTADSSEGVFIPLDWLAWGAALLALMAAGVVLYLHATRWRLGLDATGRAQTALALRQSETRYQVLTETASDAIITLDADFIIVYANPAAGRIFGHDPATLPGQPLSMLMPLEQHDSLTELFRRYLVTRRRTANWEALRLEARHADGHSLPVEVSLGEFSQDGERYITGYVRDISERNRAARELQHARQLEQDIRARIQETLLQSVPPTEIAGAEIAVLNVPSQHMDGDFFDFFTHTPHCFDLIAGDVMGKGTTAALVGAAAKTQLLRALNTLFSSAPPRAFASDGLPQPMDIVQRVHQTMTPGLMAVDRFITLVYARFHLEQHLITWVNCGHTRTIHLHQQRRQCTFLTEGQAPVGFVRDEYYTQFTRSFEPGDWFVFYSDGITEARNPSGDMFGEERLVEYLLRNTSCEPQACASRLRDILKHFTGDSRFSDDLSFLIVATEPPETCKIWEFVSDAAHIPVVRETVRAFCSEHHCDPHVVDDLELAVSEVVTNIIRHAYKEDHTRRIGIQVTVDQDAIEIRLEHWGIPVDPSQPDDPVFDGSSEGGFGLYILHQLMDDVRYEEADGAHRVYLTRHMGSPDDEDDCGGTPS